MYREEFIKKIAKYVVKHSKNYGICNNAVTIAQACLETSFGTSDLAEHYNFFGLKCGKNYKGEYITKVTTEYINNKYIQVSDNFRVFNSVENGVIGYYEFLQYDRYKNLKGIHNSHVFLELLIQDGYATDKEYINKITKLINQYNLEQYNDDYIVNLTVRTLKGEFGNGEERKEKLASYYNEVQRLINIYYRVLKGEFGNGEERKKKLASEYETIQKIINEVK